VAAGTFAALTGVCYAVYGYSFLFEVLSRRFRSEQSMECNPHHSQAYIYHFGRFDVRHNFAPHFLPM
jgi:hypothetical protein